MDKDLFGLTGKTSAVIGGGQGIGEQVSALFARAGADVAVIDLDLARAERVAASVSATGRRGVAVTADVLSDDGPASALGRADEALGGIDVLVTIVGQAQYATALEMTPEQWDLDHRRNLRYFFLAAQSFAAQRIRRNKPGAIVAIASVSGVQSAPQHSAYGAAKAGLINLVKSYAIEWAPHGIRVNAVAPGTIVTPRRPDSPEQRQRLEASAIPMRRRGQPAEIAGAVLFLASDLSSYMTGETLNVDGGWMAANHFVR
jgi:NAD(P)-dependent dehydrogenase (short-subunit alcohol dehydrogenase family)